MKRVRTSWMIALWAAVCSLGCSGGEGGIKTYPAGGKVTLDGRPTAGAVVVLHPVESVPKDFNPPNAIVDEFGEFTLTTRKTGDGAPAGTYKVTIRWLQAPPTAETGGLQAMADTESKVEPVDLLDGKYSDPKTSGLECTIEKGPTEIPPFNLKK